MVSSLNRLFVFAAIVGAACTGAVTQSQRSESQPAEESSKEDNRPADSPTALCAPRPFVIPKMNGTVSEFLDQKCTTELCDDGVRFDDCVREDALAGYAGDADALDRFWCRVKAHIEKDRNDPEAIGWRGGLQLYISGFAHRAGDFAQGHHLESMGYADLDRSLELAPNDIGVRIQHMITLASTFPYARGARKVLSIEQAQQDLDVRMHLTPHPFSNHAVGEIWAVRVQLQKARLDLASPATRAREETRLHEMLGEMAKELRGSPYEQGALCWDKGHYEAPIGCHGCH